MSELIPIFPLQIVVFPGESVNLHIFEPRYKQLIIEVEANNLKFGIPTYVEGEQLSFGTEVELIEIVNKYDDGKLDIRIKGHRTFRVLNFIRRMSNRLYSGADIEFIERDEIVDFDKNKKILKLLEKLNSFLKFHKPLPVDAYSFRSYDIAHYIGLSLKEELEILSMTSEVERQERIIQHIEKIVPILEEMNALEQKVKMNGHFKNIIPPNL